MKKELLSKNKNVLKALHELRGFDFESDYTIQKHTGKFTLNSIKKSLGFIDIENTNTVLIISDVKYREDYLYIVNVYSDGFGVSFKNRIYYRGIDDFWSKGRFEDFRKDESKNFYIISQNKELEKKASKKEVDLSNRFKYVSNIGWGNGKGAHGISQIDLLDTTHNGERFTIHTQNPSSSTDIYYFVDKSGYLVESKKEDLKRKATALRREREKNAVDEINFNNEILEIESQLLSIKNNLIVAIQKASNFDSICNIDKITSALRWLYLSIDRFKTNNESKNFSSISSAKTRLTDITNDIEKIKAMF